MAPASSSAPAGAQQPVAPEGIETQGKGPAMALARGFAPARAAPLRRIERIDALRGLALMGILQVNIQSFTWGAGEPLGYLSQPSGALESALYFLQSALFQGKFYPIFAFLFGVGIALQGRSLRRRLCGGPREVQRVQRRRLLFLFALGIVHGVFLYFGDVLSAYAACALAFLALATARPRRLLAWTYGFGALAAVSIFLPALLLGAFDSGGPSDQIPQALAHAHEIYCRAGFLTQLRQRLSDELWQQVASIPTFWPQVLALLALGTFAGRLGWLQQPERHRLVWRRAWQIGLVAGAPSALLGAAMSLARARDLPGAEAGWDDVVLGASSLLAAAYVAAAVYLFDQPWAAASVRWLASAGRMSLTNYVGQSLALGALLSGWGLGLGAEAGRAQLAAIGLLVFGAQVVLSRWTLAHFRQGPLEALWRRWTYRDARLGP